MYMKQITQYVNEKLKLGKHLLNVKQSYKYHPKSRLALKRLINKLLNEPRNHKDVLDLNMIDTSQIDDMSELFNKCNCDIDISQWDVSNVKTMRNMFGEARYMRSCGDLSKWDTHNVENFASMFKNCDNLKTIGDISQWDVSSGVKFSHMFSDCFSLTTIGNLDDWDMSHAVYLDSMFAWSALRSIGDISRWDVSNVKNIMWIFSYCKNITDVGDLEKWSSKIKPNLVMYDAFDNCGIKNIPSWHKT